ARGGGSPHPSGPPRLCRGSARPAPRQATGRAGLPSGGPVGRGGGSRGESGRHRREARGGSEERHEHARGGTMILWFTIVQIVVAVAAGVFCIAAGLLGRRPSDYTVGSLALVEALLIVQVIVAIAAPLVG